MNFPKRKKSKAGQARKRSPFPLSATISDTAAFRYSTDSELPTLHGWSWTDHDPEFEQENKICGWTYRSTVEERTKLIAIMTLHRPIVHRKLVRVLNIDRGFQGSAVQETGPGDFIEDAGRLRTGRLGRV
jgi:hypothetical protein